MELARRAGLSVAHVEMARALERDVLLVERFDRTRDGARRSMVSALTILGLTPMTARYGAYHELAFHLRSRGCAPVEDTHELFGRISFNILVSNTDDHARNSAAFWDGSSLELWRTTLHPSRALVGKPPRRWTLVMTVFAPASYADSRIAPMRFS